MSAGLRWARFGIPCYDHTPIWEAGAKDPNVHLNLIVDGVADADTQHSSKRELQGHVVGDGAGDLGG